MKKTICLMTAVLTALFCTAPAAWAGEYLEDLWGYEVRDVAGYMHKTYADIERDFTITNEFTYHGFLSFDIGDGAVTFTCYYDPTIPGYAQVVEQIWLDNSAEHRFQFGDAGIGQIVGDVAACMLGNGYEVLTDHDDLYGDDGYTRTFYNVAEGMAYDMNFSRFSSLESGWYRSMTPDELRMYG